MSVFIIRPGDQVVCVDARRPDTVTALHMLCKDRLTKGSRYRVSAVIWLFGEKGLHLEGLDHRPTDGWRADRFRKVAENESGQSCGCVAIAPERVARPLADPVYASLLIISNYSGTSLAWAG